MPKVISAFFVVLSVLLFCAFAGAQQVPDYLFLEVLDSNKKPVAGATVENAPSNFGSERKQITDEKGTVGFYLPWDNRADNLASFFTVLKDGFFTYHDFGGSGTHGRSRAQIELFKIPQTGEEKTSLGNEQLKREFMWAAKAGDAETVRKLLKKGINPNLTTSDLRGISGRKDVPAILFAVLSADSETVETLIKVGVSVRSKEEPIRSLLLTYLRADPLYWRKPKDENERREILRRYEEGVAILLKAGADLEAEDANQRKPVMVAAERGYSRAVKMLLDRGFSPNFMDERGYTLLMAAAGDAYPPIAYSKVETVELLLKSGADPNLSKDGCGSALSGAAYRGDIQVMKALLRKGAKINLDCPKVYSPLLWAVEGRKVEAARLLVEAGADIKAIDREGNDALMMAALRGDAAMTQMLLAKGFPFNNKRADGWSALLVALNSYSSPNTEVITILLKAGTEPNIVVENKINDFCLTSVKTAAEPYRLAVLKLLVENGANVNLACTNGETALSYAVTRHNPDVVKELIKYGANVYGERIDKALSLIKTYYKEGDYYRQQVDETIKIIEDARRKSQNN
jgi:ankyrin repeat protein